MRLAYRQDFVDARDHRDVVPFLGQEPLQEPGAGLVIVGHEDRGTLSHS